MAALWAHPHHAHMPADALSWRMDSWLLPGLKSSSLELQDPATMGRALSEQQELTGDVRLPLLLETEAAPEGAGGVEAGRARALTPPAVPAPLTCLRQPDLPRPFRVL